MYDSYSNKNILSEISFIGGTTFVLDFKFKNSPEHTDFLDLTGSSSEWRLTSFGEKNFNYITKKESLSQIAVVDVYTRRITLSSADTEDLNGKFVHQFLLTDSEGNLHIPAQGTVVIISQIKAESIS